MEGRIIFATGNAGKMKEIRDIMADTGMEILSMKEAGISVEISESGSTYEENALIKVRAVSNEIRNESEGNLNARIPIVMADDSGLEIDYLNGEPGVYSSRYMGEETPYSEKNKNLIERMKGVPDDLRSARFVCAIAALLPDGREITVRAAMEGRIGYAPKGENGFGYDPIFYIPELGRTSAQLGEYEKNRISHRGKALRLMKEELVK